VSIPTDSVQGTAAIQITAVDAAGNRIVLAPDFAVIDTIAPLIDASVSRNQINLPQIGLLIRSEPGVRVITERNGEILNESILQTASGVLERSLVLGENRFRFRAVDTAGNSSGWTPIVSVRYRVDPPQLTTYFLNANPMKTGSLRSSIEFSEAVTGSIRAVLAINSVSLNPVRIDTRSTGLDIEFNVTNGLNGTGHIVVSGIENLAGNSTTVDIPVEIDTTVPSVISGYGPVRFISTGNLNFDVALSEPVTISATINGNPMQWISATPSANTIVHRFSYPITESDLQGTASIRIRYSDPAGNAGETVDTRHVIDTVVPSISQWVVPTRPVSVGTFPIEFNVSEDTPTPDVRFNDQQMALANKNAVQGGLFRYRYTYAVPSSETQGPGMVIVRVRDYAGNSATAQTSLQVDTRSPILSTVSGNTLLRSAGSYELPVMISEPNVALTASMNGLILSELGRIPSGNGEWVTLQYRIDSGFPQGINPVLINAIDAAGNGASFTINTIFVDTVAPVLSSVRINDAQGNEDAAPLFLGPKTIVLDFSEPIVSVNAKVQLGTATAKLTASGPQQLIGVLSQEQLIGMSGNVTLSVSGITDQAGNSMSTFQRGFAIDTVLPQVTTVTVNAEKLNLPLALSTFNAATYKVAEGFLTVDLAFSESVAPNRVGLEVFGTVKEGQLQNTAIVDGKTTARYIFNIRASDFGYLADQNDIVLYGTAGTKTGTYPVETDRRISTTSKFRPKILPETGRLPISMAILKYSIPN
ncbi:hypothetical protein EBR96_03255, partial [bacterium]|nr:hypothetical protein [bacterium]